MGVGVIRAIDAAAGRVTIAYDAIEALGWPAGTMPFAVGRASLLEGRGIGERVRFRLESQQISELGPMTPPAPPAPAAAKPPDPVAAREAADLAGAVVTRPRR